MTPRLLFLLIVLSVVGGCCSKEQVPTQTKMLFSPVAKERNQAALYLARCGDAAAPAVGRLIELLYDPNVGVQSSAAYALRKIDTPQARAAMERVENSRRKDP